MLREYLTSIANAIRSKLGSTAKINAQDFADKIGEVYDKGLLEGLAQAKAEGRKTKYIEEYFTGSKQYLTYSIDFEPKLIIFASNDSKNTVLKNKPDINIATLNIPKMVLYCASGFVEGQEQRLDGVTVWRYKRAEDTLAYASSNSSYFNYTFNQTTGKWDITMGRADSSTSAIRFVSGGQDPIQVLFIGEVEPSVLEGTVTITENTKELKIEGLPKAPKTLNLFATTMGKLSEYSEDEQIVRGLDYTADGYYQGNSTMKRLAILWLVDKTGVGASVTISEKDSINENLITFENGVFALKISESNKKYYGKDFTFKWIATF